VFDLETNGLLNEVSTIHCGVLIDLDSEEIYRYRPHETQQLLDRLSTATELIGHNIIGYDLPVLKKLCDWVPESTVKITDTLIMSRLSNTNRPMHPSCPQYIDLPDGKRRRVGEHTLKCLGYFAGVLKNDHGDTEDWSTFSEDMLEYCVDDVKSNVSVYNMLRQELSGFSEYSIELEMDVAAILVEQQANGWTFDIKRAELLSAELKERHLEIETEVMETFQSLPKAIRTIQPRALKAGGLSSVSLKYLDDYQTIVPEPEYVDSELEGRRYTSGSFTRIDWPEFNLGSRKMIAEQLMLRGFRPKKHTEKGAVVIDESVLREIKDDFEEARLLNDYFMVSKREAMIDGWIRAYNKETGRIHGYVNTLGAITNRMTHSSPNLAQVPASKTDKEGHVIYGFDGAYGGDCRQLFTVPEGYVQVGCDAAGLELRCLAHYMNDVEYTDAILNGDIHTINQKAAGLPTRNDAKTFIYSWLYGAGDAKVGSIVGGKAKEGKVLKTKFLEALPALKVLREGVLIAAERGFLKSISGGRVRVRSPHAALNTLLQSCGAIIMKAWLRLVYKRATKAGIDFKFNGNIHDEAQAEVLAKDVKAYEAICLQAMTDAGEELNTRCPLAGDVKHGRDWSCTH